ncbi:hypothetical protein LEMLEM_LOCUS11125 [Lemmus lemmus]
MLQFPAREESILRITIASWKDALAHLEVLWVNVAMIQSCKEMIA